MKQKNILDKSKLHEEIVEIMDDSKTQRKKIYTYAFFQEFYSFILFI